MSYLNTDILIDNIKSHMEKHKMTQVQLGKAIGMSQSNLSKALNKEDKSKTFTLEQVFNIARQFNTSIDELLGYASPDELKVTPRSIAKFISAIIESEDAEFISYTKKEKRVTPNEDWYNGKIDWEDGEVDANYLAILFPSFWTVPDLSKLNDDDYCGITDTLQYDGNVTRMYPVNKFLAHFKEIHEIYSNNGLSEETYKAILNDMLNRLKE